MERASQRSEAVGIALAVLAHILRCKSLPIKEAPLRSLLGNIRKKLSGSTNIKKKGGKSHLHTNNEDYFVE